jgi:hypothetical protein
MLRRCHCTKSSFLMPFWCRKRSDVAVDDSKVMKVTAELHCDYMTHISSNPTFHRACSILFTFLPSKPRFQLLKDLCSLIDLHVLYHCLRRTQTTCVPFLVHVYPTWEEEEHCGDIRQKGSIGTVNAISMIIEIATPL